MRRLIVLWIFVVVTAVLRITYPSNEKSGATSPSSFNRTQSQIVVLVFPSTVDPDRHAERAQAIKETWGRELTVVFIGGSEADPGIRWVLPPDLKQRHQGSTDVIHFALNRAMQEFPTAQWIMKADDITFILPSNLRKYLTTLDSTAPYLAGRRLKLPGGGVFCSGGAGYALSRAAVQLLLNNWCTGEGWERNEGGDIALSKCLVKNSPADPILDTRDDGGDRFHAYPPQRVMSGQVDPWFRDYTKPWQEVVPGKECCSKNLATFHYVEYGEARAIYHILRNQGAVRAMSDAGRRELYPKGPPLLSGYSMAPKEDDPMWNLLLYHISV
eukprot:Sspe_Gene.67983::Locus_40103_Transcript_1_1_Confidence_1.000_Length_1097::g.67983::m.67983/K00731/C1GALT1; glycoprotein-N-acetylgalactosamine 3-beta-galactosyltransferase